MDAGGFPATIFCKADKLVPVIAIFCYPEVFLAYSFVPPYLYKNKTCLYKQAFPLPLSSSQLFQAIITIQKWHLIYAPPGKSDINSNIFSAYHAPKQPSRIACL